MFDSIAKKLLQPINTSLALLIGLYNFLIGLWLCLPFDSVQELIRTYNVSEFHIGIWIGIIGIVIIAGVLSGKYELLVSGSLLSFLSWLAGFIFLLLSNFTGVAWITALVIATYCGTIFINLRVNKEVYEKD